MSITPTSTNTPVTPTLTTETTTTTVKDTSTFSSLPQTPSSIDLTKNTHTTKKTVSVTREIQNVYQFSATDAKNMGKLLNTLLNCSDSNVSEAVSGFTQKTNQENTFWRKLKTLCLNILNHLGLGHGKSIKLEQNFAQDISKLKKLLLPNNIPSPILQNVYTNGDESIKAACFKLFPDDLTHLLLEIPATKEEVQKGLEDMLVYPDPKQIDRITQAKADGSYKTLNFTSRVQIMEGTPQILQKTLPPTFKDIARGYTYTFSFADSKELEINPGNYTSLNDLVENAHLSPAEKEKLGLFLIGFQSQGVFALHHPRFPGYIDIAGDRHPNIFVDFTTSSPHITVNTQGIPPDELSQHRQPYIDPESNAIVSVIVGSTCEFSFDYNLDTGAGSNLELTAFKQNVVSYFNNSSTP